MGSTPGFFTGPDGEKRDQQLIDLVAKGDHSFSEIAAIMGAGSRNVVLCRFNRIKKKFGRQHVLVAQPRSGNVHDGAAKRVYTTKAKPLLPTVVALKPSDIVPVRLEDGAPVTEVTVGGNMCRFPLGDLMTGNYHYCGHPKQEGSSYCATHHRVCYIKPEKRVNHLGRKRA